MKFYEGSIGDRVARMKGGKLQLSDVLRLCYREHISSFVMHKSVVTDPIMLMFTGMGLSWQKEF